MKKLLSAALAALLAVSAAATAALAEGAQLSDVPEGAWYAVEVDEMVAAGYISGYEDGSFRPDNEVSLAEFVTMTARCQGLETGEEYGHWAGVQMRNAYDSGWLTEEDAALDGVQHARHARAGLPHPRRGAGAGDGGRLPHSSSRTAPASTAPMRPMWRRWWRPGCSTALRTAASARSRR